VWLQGGDTQRKIHRKSGIHVRVKRLIDGRLNDKERKYIKTNSQTKVARFVRNREKRGRDVLLVSGFV
jgi:hypothetical protein